jgi:hypothetical protein
MKLEASGTDPLLISSYTTLAPLLAERDAVTAFLSRTENSGLIGMMPNPVTPVEATELAQQELPILSVTQLKTLESMLSKVM